MTGDQLTCFAWQSHGTTIEGHRNETLWLRVRAQRHREELAQCDRENTHAE